MDIEMPTPEELRAFREEMEAEHAYWREHYEELKRQYPDHHVAVYNGRVIAASKDLFQFADMIRAQGLDPSETWTEFLAADPRPWLL